MSPLKQSRLQEPRFASADGRRFLDPRMGRQPNAKELPLHTVRDALQARGVLSADPGDRGRELIAIRALKGAKRMYLPVDLLAYVAQGSATDRLSTDDVEIAIGEGGHLLPRVSEAFAGTRHYARMAAEVAAQPSADESGLPDELTARMPAAPDVSSLHTQLAQAEAQIQTIAETERDVAEEPGSEPLTSLTELRAEREDLQAEVAALRGQLGSYDVRQLETWELRDTLREARYRTRQRLLIISPWVTRQVVDDEFVNSLARLASTGVRVHIGYGIAESDAKNDQRVLGKLGALAEKSNGKVSVRNLGITHEKVLIFDDTAVTGSFNWLSFKGDPSMPLRRESATLVREHGFVDSTYEHYVSILEGTAT